MVYDPQTGGIFYAAGRACPAPTWAAYDVSHIQIRVLCVLLNKLPSRLDPGKLWSTNIFGKSLNELVSEGVQAKLLHMPQEARSRLQQTLERIINEGCDGLICILL